MNSALTAQRNRQHPYSKPWYINTRAHNVYGNPLKHAVMIINHVLLTEKRRNTLGVSNACEFIRHALEVIYGIPVLSILCYNGAHCTHGAKCTHKHTEYPTGSLLVTDDDLMGLINNTIWHTKRNVKPDDDAFPRLVSTLENLKVLLYPHVGAPATRAIGTMSVGSAPVFPTALPKLTDADLERVRNRVVTCSAERK